MNRFLNIFTVLFADSADPWTTRAAARLGMALLLSFGTLAHSQTAGDPNKYSSTPGNPACRFFDGFADNGDGTVTDPRNGLMWKRCAEGSAWNGKACSVAGTQMNWVEAMKTAKTSRFLGHSDWRLPTRGELNAVVGNYEQCKTNDFKKGQYAASAAITHSINKDLSPGWFWTSSPSVDGSGNAGSVVFVNGYVGDYNRTHGGNVNVRLVRSSLSSGSAAALEFDTEYAKLAQYQRLIDEVKAKEQAQRDAEEAQRKAQQARAAAVKSLLAQGPQGLYLQAGRAQRDGGGARINGEYFSAKQMYDLIVDNFPKSEFSVKASDQLNAMARGEVQERSEREARGRAWCEAELRRREASCNTAENPAGCVSYHRNSFRCD